jgi:PemK-like, MazF-like toxin of type II toxin-antitoxin system
MAAGRGGSGSGSSGPGARLVRALLDVLRAVLRPSRRSCSRTAPAPAAPGRYAGDAPDVPDLQYAPYDDDRADPGEIVWAWVPFEEDHSRGKDRPVLVVGRRGRLLLALMLTSKDHDRDGADEARYGRHWVDIGSGDWDRQGRPSEVRVDRVLQLAPSAVRRQGSALDRERFDRVAASVRRYHRAG